MCVASGGAFSGLLGVSLVIFVFFLLQMFGFSELSSHRDSFNSGLKSQSKKRGGGQEKVNIYFSLQTDQELTK